MLFGSLGSLPLGGYSLPSVYVRGASYWRRGKKWEPPDREEQPDWVENLAKAREALWLKRYEEATRIEERDENLQKAWSALMRKYEEDERNRPREEIRRRYYDNLPQQIRERMQVVEQRVSAHKAIEEEEVILRKTKIIEEARAAALQLANEARQKEKERKEQIYKQRVKSLKKARRVKAKRNTK